MFHRAALAVFLVSRVAMSALRSVVAAIVPCKRMFANVKTAFYVSFKGIFSLLVSKLSKSGSEMRREVPFTAV